MILLWRLLFFTALLCITILAFLPDYSALPPVVSISDLANHAAAFAVLFLLFRLAYGAWGDGYLTLLLMAYGGVIEIVQAFLPTRYASFEDMAADGAGVVAGMLISRIFRPKGQKG